MLWALKSDMIWTGEMRLYFFQSIRNSNSCMKVKKHRDCLGKGKKDADNRVIERQVRKVVRGHLVEGVECLEFI